MSWCSALLLLLAAPQEAQDRADLRGRLQQVLRNETNRGGENPEFEKWKRDWLNSKFDPPKPPELPELEINPPKIPNINAAAIGTTLLWVIVIVISAAVIASAIYAVVVWRRERRPRTTPPAAPVDAVAATDDALRQPPEGWLEDARRFVAQGDYRQAVRCLMLAILNTLHRVRQIDYEKSKTNRECLAGFRGEAGRRGNFSSLITTFELAWYGGFAVEPDDYRKAESIAVALREGAPHE